MENRNYAEELYLQLKQLEEQITDFERDCARRNAAGKTGHAGAPDGRTPAPAFQQQRSGPERLRDLLSAIKEGPATDIPGTLLRENDLPALKQEISTARQYISMLQDIGEKEPAAADGLKTDLALTEPEDRAHNQLETERQEFKSHYDALEQDFEGREKKLLDELRDLGERATKQELELRRLRIDLETAREKMEAAESKASSISMEMLEMNVFNKSAAAALNEKDREISDLKQALKEARSGTGSGAPRA